MSGPVDVLAVCPHCGLPMEASQSSKWHIKADTFSFRNSRAPTRRYRVHVICPNFYDKQRRDVNARFDAAIAMLGKGPEWTAPIEALDVARAAELSMIDSRAALANVGSAS